MKLAIIRIASLAHEKWKNFSALLQDNGNRRFPTIVAHTSEGQIMDGPRGLQLITPCGPTPAYKTPNGFLVYNPAPHILHSLKN